MELIICSSQKTSLVYLAQRVGDERTSGHWKLCTLAVWRGSTLCEIFSAGTQKCAPLDSNALGTVGLVGISVQRS